MVETRVFPSPVFISATIPRCSAAAPMICTSKCRWPSTRLRSLPHGGKGLDLELVQALAGGDATTELCCLGG